MIISLRIDQKKFFNMYMLLYVCSQLCLGQLYSSKVSLLQNLALIWTCFSKVDFHFAIGRNFNLLIFINFCSCYFFQPFLVFRAYFMLFSDEIELLFITFCIALHSSVLISILITDGLQILHNPLLKSLRIFYDVALKVLIVLIKFSENNKLL